MVVPPVDEKGEKKNGEWFDVARLDVTHAIPVMNVPDFSMGYIAEGNKGSAEKPLP